MEIHPHPGALPDGPDPEGEHPEAAALFDRAESQHAAGQVDAALWTLWEARETAPDLWLTHYRYAELLLSLGGDRSREALPAARRARELAPTIASTHTMLGLVLEAGGDRKEAHAAYTRALELDPDHVGALNNLASLDLARWRLAGAAGHLGRALETDPSLAATRVNLALVATRMGLRLLAGLVSCAIVLAALLGLEASAAARALSCVGLALAVGALAFFSWRALPAGARAGSVRVIPVLPRSLLVVALAVCALTVLVMGLAPHEIAQETGSGALLVVLDLAVLAAVVTLLVHLLRGRRS